jgi:hypothetical protein
MPHMILVALASSVVGAAVIVGVVFLLLKVFAPQVFLATELANAAALAEATNVEALEARIVSVIDSIARKSTGPSQVHAMGGRVALEGLKSAIQKSSGGVAIRRYRVEVSAMGSLNPDLQAYQDRLLGNYEDSENSEQSEQDIPQQHQGSARAARVQ